MEAFSLGQIVSAAGGRFFGEPALLSAPVADVVIDSRLAGPGALYAPILGERFDGHMFIDAARKNGALCVLTAHPLEREPYVLVPDTLLALQSIASFYRDQFDIPVVGITGSVGKTSTKEMVAAVLETRYRVLKTVGSMNNQTGVPLTLFRLDRTHEAAVVELGTNHFGEIETLSRIVKPTVCLFTNIGVAHIEFFGSREGILKGKAEMLAGMKPGGSVLVNGDDDLLVRIPNATRYGLSEGCALRGVSVQDHGLDGMSFTARFGEECVPVRVPSPGMHSVSNALAAMATGLALGMPLAETARGVEAFTPPSGRMSIRHTDRLTVLDDAYNANPTSMAAAIDVLQNVPGRRVCVLGDMLELGEKSEEFHEVVGMYAARHNMDLILCVGPNSLNIYTGACAIAPERAQYFETQDDLLPLLPALICDGDTVLVKASRGMRLERTVARLTEL